MNQQELYAKLSKQYQEGLITIDEFYDVMIEEGLLYMLRVAESMSK